MKKVIVCTVFLLLAVSTARAGVVNLKNGDKITGKIIEETNEDITIESEVLGTFMIEREYIKDYMTDSQMATKQVAEKEEAQKWKRKVSVGLSKLGGNDQEFDATISLSANRKTDDNETTIKVSKSYEETDGKLDNKEFDGLLRHAYNFGEAKKWFHFGKLEVKKNLDQNIDWRITPSTGIGYWFADEDDFKAMADVGIGFENTRYRDGTKSEGEAVIVPHGYIEKTFDNKMKLSEDLTIYPSLEETSEFRVVSETALSHPLNDRTDITITFKDEYDSAPKGGKKKNDTSLTTSVDVSF